MGWQVGLVIKQEGYRPLIFELCQSWKAKVWGAAMFAINMGVAYYAAHHELCGYFFSMQFSFEHTAKICADGTRCATLSLVWIVFACMDYPEDPTQSSVET